MADTTSSNAKPARPEEREEANLPPMSFAEAVKQQGPIEPEHGAKSDDKPHSEDVANENELQEQGEQADGLLVEDIKKDEPIPTEGIMNEKVNTTDSDRVQKTELGDSREEDTPKVDEVNGFQKSYAEAAVNPPPEQSSPREQNGNGNGNDRTLRNRQSSMNGNGNGLSSAPSTVSFRSGYAEQFEDTEFEDTDIFENYLKGERLVSIRTPRSPKMTKSKNDQPQPAHKIDEDRTLITGREAGANWHKSKIRFAPLNIPLQRRLQTAVVLMHTLCLAGGIGAFLFMCAIPLLWPIIVPYMIYIMFSKAGTSGELSHRSDRWRKSKIWSLFAGYFPARLHRTQELSPTRKYIFGYHPHGIISHGAFAAFGTEALGFDQLFPGITNSLLTLDSNFRIPLYREYALFLGLASVSRQSCENLLSKGGINGEGMGRAITIVVGGARESLDAMPYTMKLTLKRRYGFVKMAMRTGADLVPVLAFGENELYDQFSVENRPWIKSLQYALKSVMGWTLPLFHARGVFNYDVGLVPYRRPVNIVVGRPIQVCQNRKPTTEDVERVHKQYCDELTRIWEIWNDDFAPNRKEEMMICG